MEKARAIKICIRIDDIMLAVKGCVSYGVNHTLFHLCAPPKEEEVLRQQRTGKMAFEMKDRLGQLKHSVGDYEQARKIFV